ncbi:MAG: hypothetical protein JWN14_1810 [Chthonomonadales bacterium]|nr:hypothetical protein [Chthonomonadales bacterium]
MNRSNKSPFSLESLLNRARLPIEARVRAILSPQYRQQFVRSITMLTVAGAVGCAIGLASVQVKAGQAGSQERVAIARAQAELDAVLEAKSRAEAAQSSAREASSKAQKSARSEEAATLRRKLDILEQLLVRNQEENAQLRQQLKALMAQNKNAAAISGQLGRENAAKNKIMDRAAQQRAAAMDKMRDREAQQRSVEAERDASRAQKRAIENMVSDMKQQQLLLENRVKQTEELYRSGHTSAQELNRLKVDQETARLRLESAMEQLRAAQAGQKISQKEQNLTELRLRLAELQAQLKQEDASLALVKARRDAGIASNGEVLEVEAKISSIKVEIDKLQLKLSQEAGH